MIFGREVAGFLALIRAVLALIVLFGLPIDDIKSGALYIVIELGILWWTRSSVTPIHDPKVPLGTHVKYYAPDA